MSFIVTTVHTTELTWHTPRYLMWESTEVTSCRIQSGEKQKALENVSENDQQKWLSGPKSIQLDSVVFVFSKDCAKMSTPLRGIQFCFCQFEKSWPQQGRGRLHRLGLPSETARRKAWCTLKISEMVFYLSGAKPLSPAWLAANGWGFSFLILQLPEFTFPARAVRCASLNFKHNDSSEWLPL